MRLTTVGADRKPLALIRSQPHMYPMAAYSWISLSPCPPSQWEGGSFCLRICLAYRLPDAILVSSAEVLLHKGTFERLEQCRAPLNAFLLAIDLVNEGSEGILEREWWKWKMKSLSV